MIHYTNKKAMIALGIFAIFGASFLGAPLLAEGSSGFAKSSFTPSYPERSVETSIRPAPLNRPPVIEGVSGPSELKTGEEGTWRVRAHDPEGGSLRYLVEWGEIRYYPLGGMAFESRHFSQTATFTHSYYSPGTYSITFTVADQFGASSRTTLTAYVRSGSIPPPSRPFVDLKINGSDGPVIVKGGGALLFSWKSSQVASCRAYGKWVGGKPVRGEEKSFAPRAAGIYTYGMRCSPRYVPLPYPAKSGLEENEVVTRPYYVISDTVEVRVLGSARKAGFVMVGDFDVNGRVTIFEAVKMIDFLRGTEQPTRQELARADGDGNGKVDMGDVTFAIDNAIWRKPLRAVTSAPRWDKSLALAGDLNHDGKVSIGELTRIGFFVSGEVLPTAEEKAISDADGDGGIDRNDFLAVKDNFFGNRPFRCVRITYRTVQPPRALKGSLS